MNILVHFWNSKKSKVDKVSIKHLITNFSYIFQICAYESLKNTRYVCDSFRKSNILKFEKNFLSFPEPFWLR